jgi:pimeloyl-ACP methyl ester carboxylesterase
MTETRSLLIGGLQTSLLEAMPETPTIPLPVLALHGWGASAELMRVVVERLAAGGARVIAPDLPGFGSTALPPPDWDVFAYARWVVGLLDTLEIARCHLVGHSFGGRLGLLLGADYPERLDRMILVDSAGIPPKRPLGSQLRLKAYKGIRDGLKAAGAASLSDRLRAWYSGRYGSADFQTAGPLRDIFVRVVNQDLSDYAKRVTPSTLLVWGDQDQDTPLWQGQMLEKLIPDAGLVTLKGAGHYSYLERPAEFATIALHFLREG